VNLEDTTEIDKTSLINFHIMDWRAWKLKNRTTECDDVRLLAGCYLDWTKGNLPQAIRAVLTHCSGTRIDRPPFELCRETLGYLRDLEHLINEKELD